MQLGGLERDSLQAQSSPRTASRPLRSLSAGEIPTPSKRKAVPECSADFWRSRRVLPRAVVAGYCVQFSRTIKREELRRVDC